MSVNHPPRSGANLGLVDRLRGVLADLVDFTDRHRLSHEDHDHDCYQEWTLLRDEAVGLLGSRQLHDPDVTDAEASSFMCALGLDGDDGGAA